jgi:rhodanese-related sulfurtransferase
LPQGKEIIVVCTTGNSAARCAAVLSEKEFNATVLVGGITAWKEFIRNK